MPAKPKTLRQATPSRNGRQPSSASNDTGFAVVDQQLRVVKADKKFLAFLGLTGKQCDGKPLPELLNGITPELSPLLLQVLESAEPVLNVEMARESSGRYWAV